MVYVAQALVAQAKVSVAAIFSDWVAASGDVLSAGEQIICCCGHVYPLMAEVLMGSCARLGEYGQVSSSAHRPVGPRETGQPWQKSCGAVEVTTI